MQTLRAFIKGYLILAFVFAIFCFLAPREWSRQTLRFFVGIILAIYLFGALRYVKLPMTLTGYEGLCQKLENIEFDNAWGTKQYEQLFQEYQE